jgi:hypothetical protein
MRGGPRYNNTFQELDVRYFDVTHDIPKQYADLMNLKLKEMKDGYEKTLSHIAEQNDEFQRKVEVLDRINSKAHISFTSNTIFRGRNQVQGNECGASDFTLKLGGVKERNNLEAHPQVLRR